MKHCTSNTPLARTFETASPRTINHAVSEAYRDGSMFKSQRTTDTKYCPIADRHINYEVETLQPSNQVTIQRIAKPRGRNFAKGGVAVNDSTVKRFKVTVVDRKTGEPVEVLAKLEMRTVAVLSYGMTFTFAAKRGSQTVLDSRSGKRVSVGFMHSELRRLLGATEGDAKFAEFIG